MELTNLFDPSQPAIVQRILERLYKVRPLLAHEAIKPQQGERWKIQTKGNFGKSYVDTIHTVPDDHVDRWVEQHLAAFERR